MVNKRLGKIGAFVTGMSLIIFATPILIALYASFQYALEQ